MDPQCQLCKRRTKIRLLLLAYSLTGYRKMKVKYGRRCHLILHAKGACVCLAVCVYTHSQVICLQTGEGFCPKPVCDSLAVIRREHVASKQWRQLGHHLEVCAVAASADASRPSCQNSACQTTQTICSHQQEDPDPGPFRREASYINGRLCGLETHSLCLALITEGRVHSAWQL